MTMMKWARPNLKELRDRYALYRSVIHGGLVRINEDVYALCHEVKRLRRELETAANVLDCATKDADVLSKGLYALARDAARSAAREEGPETSLEDEYDDD